MPGETGPQKMSRRDKEGKKNKWRKDWEDLKGFHPSPESGTASKPSQKTNPKDEGAVASNVVAMPQQEGARHKKPRIEPTPAAETTAAEQAAPVPEAFSSTSGPVETRFVPRFQEQPLKADRVTLAQESSMEERQAAATARLAGLRAKAGERIERAVGSISDKRLENAAAEVASEKGRMRRGKRMRKTEFGTVSGAGLAHLDRAVEAERKRRSVAKVAEDPAAGIRKTAEDFVAKGSAGDLEAMEAARVRARARRAPATKTATPERERGRRSRAARIAEQLELERQVAGDLRIAGNLSDAEHRDNQRAQRKEEQFDPSQITMPVEGRFSRELGSPPLKADSVEQLRAPDPEEQEWESHFEGVTGHHVKTPAQEKQDQVAQWKEHYGSLAGIEEETEHAQKRDAYYRRALYELGRYPDEEFRALGEHIDKEMAIREGRAENDGQTRLSEISDEDMHDLFRAYTTEQELRLAKRELRNQQEMERDIAGLMPEVAGSKAREREAMAALGVLAERERQPRAPEKLSAEDVDAHADTVANRRKQRRFRKTAAALRNPDADRSIIGRLGVRFRSSRLWQALAALGVVGAVGVATLDRGGSPAPKRTVERVVPDRQPAVRQAQPPEWFRDQMRALSAKHPFAERFVVQENRPYIWNVVDKRLSDMGLFYGMREKQRDRIVDTYIRYLRSIGEGAEGVKRLKSMGFTSGDVDVIHKGEVIDLSVLDRTPVLYPTRVTPPQSPPYINRTALDTNSSRRG